MGKYKVCVYAVAKNEEKFADRFMDSLKEADAVYIGDTGSTDNTVEKFRQRGAIVYEIPIVPWRFDKARNELLKEIPEDYDICVSMDVDEVISPGWRKCLENAWTAETTIARYLYIWSFNPDGTPGVQYNHHRIHARKGYRWIYPTHEVLDYIGEGEQKSTFIDGLAVKHYPDNSKDRGFNLELLELALKEFPNDVRNTHYYGRELMFAGKWDESIATLKKYLSLPGATWEEERGSAMKFIAICYNAKGDYQQARSWLLRAMAETPYSRDPFIEAAYIAYNNQDWVTTFFATTKGLDIKEKFFNGYPSDARGWRWDIYDLAAIACYNLGMYKESLEYAKIALKLCPTDVRLKKNLQIIYDKVIEVYKE